MKMSRRQLLKTGAVAAVTAPLTAACGAAPVAAPVTIALATSGLAWLADVAASVAANLITEKVQSDAPGIEWTAEGQQWAGRYMDAWQSVGVHSGWTEVYGISPYTDGASYPGGCMGAVMNTTDRRALDAALFVTRDDAVVVDWWARQGISMLMAQTNREGVDATAKLREKKLLLLTVLPARSGQRGSDPTGRIHWLNYYAADGSVVAFTYARSADGSERVTVDAPGFPQASAPAVWEVPLSREASM